MKIPTFRIPQGQPGNKELFSSCSSNCASECRIIHLMRDPRAVITSLMTSFSETQKNKDNKKWFVHRGGGGGGGYTKGVYEGGTFSITNGI